MIVQPVKQCSSMHTRTPISNNAIMMVETVLFTAVNTVMMVMWLSYVD